jgi:hypothetical protein
MTINYETFANATETERAAALAEIGLKLSYVCINEGKADIPGIQKGCPSEWSVTLSRGKLSFTTTYTKGCGLRRYKNGMERYTDAHGVERHRPKYRRIPSIWGRPTPQQWKALENSVPEPVGIVELCYSLAMDAQCGSQTFAEFCSECGYDEDSRKAFDMYMACQKIATDLRRIGVSIEKLAEITYGY